jgi:hypothetical protein
MRHGTGELFSEAVVMHSDAARLSEQEALLQGLYYYYAMSHKHAQASTECTNSSLVPLMIAVGAVGAADAALQYQDAASFGFDPWQHHTSVATCRQIPSRTDASRNFREYVEQRS